MARKAARKAAKKAAGKAEKKALRDDGEDVYLMEPMRISEENQARPELTELVLELTKRSSSFRSSLPKGLTEPLADFVRSMNCYYSNLIEGHDTHPVEMGVGGTEKLARDFRGRVRADRLGEMQVFRKRNHF